MSYKEYMQEALKLAKFSYNENEIPVGAVIVKDNKIISYGRNKREQKNNALYHAEIEAINNACKHLNSWRLNDCDIYVTLEPCIMCTGAIINSRIRKIYFGAYDLKNGFCESKYNINDLKDNYRPEIQGGILEDECEKILKDFFNKLRLKK